MINGNFTGKKLQDYFNGQKSDWYNARKIVNGNDKKYTIGDYGMEFFAAISFNYVQFKRLKKGLKKCEVCTQ